MALSTESDSSDPLNYPIRSIEVNSSGLFLSSVGTTRVSWSVAVPRDGILPLIVIGYAAIIWLDVTVLHSVSDKT